jgi:adenylosuccinate synthase
MELDELNAKGVTPDVYVDTRALVTTPFDIMLNQALETKRGGDRHGSVGMGIGTTVERHDTIPLSFADLEIWSTQELSNVLHIIGARTRRQMINNNVDSHYINMVDDHIIERIIYDFISDITFMLNKVTTVCTPEFLPDYNTVIFEAGQGLLLDIEYGMFPYVTHSHCGARNIHTILDEINFKGELQLNYITRTYLTRHGAGPLESEVRWDVGLEDKTNKTNEFQGSLRFAPLDIASLMCRVTDDAIYCEQQSYSCTTRINVTCMDQDHDLFSNKDPELNPRQPFIDIGSTWSYGPTRQDVRI